MSYIYQAELWCDTCGAAICDALDAEGKGHDRSDETSYDSDDYPKGPFSDSDESDTPSHCASGETCPNAVTLDDGRPVGAIVSGLTADGRAYVEEAADSPCARLWREHYGIGRSLFNVEHAVFAIFPIALLAKLILASI